MFVSVITPPAFEPVTLAEARRQLRLNEATDDSKVSELIAVARGHVEDISSLALATRAVEARFSDTEPLILPLGHVTAVTSVKYLDADGVEQIADTSDYRVDTGASLSRVIWADTAPTMLAAGDAVRVRYSVGYASAADMPPALRQAVMIVLADLYETRVPREVTLSTVEALVAPWVLS